MGRGLTGGVASTIHHTSPPQGYIYAGVIVGMGLVQLMLHHQVQFMGWRLGMAMRTSLEAAVFRKVLRMPLRCVCVCVWWGDRAR